jgi:hypothetical protein
MFLADAVKNFASQVYIRCGSGVADISPHWYMWFCSPCYIIKNQIVIFDPENDTVSTIAEYKTLCAGLFATLSFPRHDLSAF